MSKPNPTRKPALMWAEMNPYVLAAIELATGLCFKRTLAPPVGLWSMVHDLEAEAKRRWPGDRTVGQMARLYLEQRTNSAQNGWGTEP